MKNVQEITNYLIKYGWATFTIKEVVPHIDPILTDFKKLISEPDDYKAPWKIHIPELSNKADHGLLPPKGEGFDQKWMLMWRKNLESMLLDGRITQDQFEPYRKLFFHMNEMFKIGYRHVLQIAAEFDKQVPGFCLYQHINKQSLMNTHVLRLPEYLYDPDAPDRLFSARTHVDIGAITLQMLETSPGLILRGYDGKLIDYKCNLHEGTVVAFLGDKMEQLTQEKFKAVPHGVLALAKENRNSLMLFAHTEHPSRERDGMHVSFDEMEVRQLMDKMMAVA